MSVETQSTVDVEVLKGLVTQAVQDSMTSIIQEAVRVVMESNQAISLPFGGLPVWMWTPEEGKKVPLTLIDKLTRVMGMISKVPKNGYNSHQNYKYPDHNDVMEAVRGYLAEEGVILIPAGQSWSKQGNIEEVIIDFTFVCKDTGGMLTFPMKGKGQDTQEKGANKAYSSAYKNALLKFFLIPAGDEKDPDSDDSSKKSKGNARNTSNSSKSNSSSAKKVNNDPEKVKTFSSLFNEKMKVQKNLKSELVKQIGSYTSISNLTNEQLDKGIKFMQELVG